MAKQSASKTTEAFEKALQEQAAEKYLLRLYVAGNTNKSAHAILILKQLCEQELKGRYQLEVIDINQQPGKARSEQIIATPTLIKTLPLPIRRIIGDLSKIEKVLVGLGLEKVDD
jgi:circadian clock protein KaiB